MRSFLALCLLIFQAIAPAPKAHVAARDLRAYASGVVPRVEASPRHEIDVGSSESLSRDGEHRDAVAWARDARPFVAALTTRGHTPARTPVFGASLGQLSMEAAFAATVRVRTLDDSHAISARGALLPYFPTAPPLRG